MSWYAGRHQKLSKLGLRLICGKIPPFHVLFFIVSILSHSNYKWDMSELTVGRFLRILRYLRLIPTLSRSSALIDDASVNVRLESWAEGQSLRLLDHLRG